MPCVITTRDMAHAVRYSPPTAEVWVNPTLLRGICGGLSDTQFSSPNSVGIISQMIHTRVSFFCCRRCMNLAIDVVVKQETKISTTNKMQRYTIFFIIVNALHVSSGFAAHHQELKNCIHSIGYMLSLLAATASVGDLEPPETRRALTIIKNIV